MTKVEVRGEIIGGVFVPHTGILPAKSADAILIFTTKDDNEQLFYKPRKRMTQEEAKMFLDEYQGCLKTVTDPKEERLAYLDEKYGTID